jgi:histidinol-phosphate/aromatic aminotransferase/cobyric acid decarboxylase-like protein
MNAVRLPSPPAIEAISKLTDLERLADDFKSANGYAPELISHWDPKSDFGSRIETFLIGSAARPRSLVEYTYSGYVEIDKRVRVLLNETDDRALLLTPSGTTSIANTIAYLKNVGCKNLHIIAPHYFAVEATASVFGLSTSFQTIVRQGGKYDLPEYRGPGDLAAVWLTLPVYGASSYISPKRIATYIDELPEELIAVVDEGLAFSDRPSLSHVQTMARVIRLATPHKAICANGEKVSFVSFPRHLADEFDAWSECFAGGIGVSGARALSFLGSDRYAQAVQCVREMLSECRSRMRYIAARRSSITLDEETDGHFVTVYWPKLPMSIGDDTPRMRKLVAESGCVPMPSSRNRHPTDYGFAFRVNLLRLDEAGLGAFSRLAEALDRLV